MKSNIAVDVGSSNMRAASFIPGSPEAIQSNRIQTRSEGMSVEDRLLNLIETVIPENYPPASIGVASPGPLDPINGIVIEPPAIPEWRYFPLQEYLENHFSVPVRINTDANLAALGEWSFGAGKGFSNLIYIAVSTGIGGGIIVENSLLRGSSGFSNEIGHLMVDPDGPKCTCGIHGHLESLSSGPAMVRWVMAQLSDDKIDNLFQSENLNPKDLEDAAASGNQLAFAAYERSGRYLGIAIADLIHIFNPEIVLIGGGISNAGELLLKPIRESVAKHLISSAYLDNLVISQAELGDKSGLLGALVLAREINPA